MSVKINRHQPPAKGPGATTPNTVRVTLAKDGTLTLPNPSGVPDIFSVGAGNGTPNTLRVVVADS